MHQQSSRATDDIESTRVYRKPTNKRQDAAIYKDSRMTLDSLKNSKIHTFLIEEIRTKLTEVEKSGKLNFPGLKLTSGFREMS